tara:strand:+ start:109 stop:957 length:849 start_codon:yes stop_codon:yes gene_type:complete
MNNIVADINKTLEDISLNKVKVSEELIEEVGEEIKQALRDWSNPKPQQGFTLRASNIGKPLRKLWFEKRKQNIDEPLSASLNLKFLYGHILESLVIFLVKLSGNKVTDQQKEIEVNGVKGHIDCKINDTVVDIKSASKFSFNKFSKGLLAEEDPFGYIPQLTAYEHAEKSKSSYFLVVDKESGELCTYEPDNLEKPDITKLISYVMDCLESDITPDKCFSTIPEGKKGNKRLSANCTYCEFKRECYKDSNNGKGLRVFNYAKGPMFLETVVSEPKVEEIYEW